MSEHLGLQSMTLRDYMAVACLQGIIVDCNMSDQDISRAAYRLADAMIEERDRKHTTRRD